MSRRSATTLHLLLVFLPLVATAQPLFDAHLHYNAEDARQYRPGQIIEILQRAEVPAAVVTSRPPTQVLALHALAPERIVPLLGVYRQPADKETWHQDATLPARVAGALTDPRWAGVGELHLFAPQRQSPVFRRIVELATARGLPLQLHTDPATLDSLFDHAPGAVVLWAHAGAYPYPPLLRDYLARYPNLHIDLSVRDGRIAPDGRLDPAWEQLFLEYPARFLVGVDTFSTGRWGDYGDVAATIRRWLAELPPEVAAALACGNAARLFDRPVCSPQP
ncbi:MAG: amidohydrolase family protein [Chromatiales bacterium]|nr:amidohydrolase family protein [Chromatiales bacterium]